MSAKKTDSKEMKVPNTKEKGKGWGFGSILRTFGLSRGEMRHSKFLSTKSKKLPKNFANMVLDQEMKIDSG